VEAGKYKSKIEYAKTDAVEDQMWYTLKEQVDSTVYSNIEVNKVLRVDFKDSSGDYIRIPRLLDNEVLKMDIT
jgi:ribulose bisphosphate carboxylase small subunit